MKKPAKRKLTPKQERFVAEYLVSLNATDAARKAGFGKKAASSVGYEYLRKPHIAAAVAAGKTKQLASCELSASRVLEEMRRLAFLDARSFFDRKGNLIPLHKLTAEQGSALSGFEAIIKNAKAGDGVTDTIHKIKFWDKPRTLEMLAKHFALLHDVVTVKGEAELVAFLQGARRRTAA